MRRFAKRVGRIQTLDIWIVVSTEEMLSAEMVTNGFEALDDDLSEEQVKATYKVSRIIPIVNVSTIVN